MTLRKYYKFYLWVAFFFCFLATSAAFGQILSVQDFKGRGIFDPAMVTVLVMNFQDYSGDPSLIGLKVAVPNEIANKLRKKTGIKVTRVVETPVVSQAQSSDDKTTLSFAGIALKFSPSAIIEWLKGKKLALVVEGEYAKLGNELTLTARRIDAKTKQQVGDDVSVKGPIEATPALLEGLSEKLLVEWPLPEVPGFSLPKIDAPKINANLDNMFKKFSSADMSGIKAKDFKPESLFKKSKPNSSIVVKIVIGKDNYKIGEKAQIKVVSNTDGYLTLIDIGTSENVHVIFPNHWETNNFIKANEWIIIPETGKTDYLMIDGPTGKNRIMAILTKDPSALVLPDLTNGFGALTKRDIKVMPDTLKSTEFNFTDTYFTIIESSPQTLP